MSKQPEIVDVNPLVGKGDGPRRMDISRKQFESNWEAIFGKQNHDKKTEETICQKNNDLKKKSKGHKKNCTDCKSKKEQFQQKLNQ